MKRVAIYTCTDDETELRAVTDYATREGWEVVRVFEDLEGYLDLELDTLPLALSEARCGVEAGEFECVVMLSPDRLGRRTGRFLTSFLALRWVGAEVAYVQEADEHYTQLMRTVDRWLDDIALTPNTGRRERSVAEFRARDAEEEAR